MTDNAIDNTNEKADTASNETRDTYERDSDKDVKSAEKSTFKTAGVEGQKIMDEVKNPESHAPAPSDLKGEAKKAGWDLK